MITGFTNKGWITGIGIEGAKCYWTSTENVFHVYVFFVGGRRVAAIYVKFKASKSTN